MTVAAVNFYSLIRACRSENFTFILLLAMRYSLSSEMSLLSEKGKGGLKSLCMAAVSQFSE